MSPTRITLIDDNPIITDAYREALVHHGFEVEVAHTGTEGINLVRQSKPDIVLLDILLHDLDGLAVLEQFKKDPETASIPVFIVTMDDHKVTQSRALSLGAHAYYHKDNLSIDSLAEHIHSLIHTSHS